MADTQRSKADSLSVKSTATNFSICDPPKHSVIQDWADFKVNAVAQLVAVGYWQRMAAAKPAGGPVHFLQVAPPRHWSKCSTSSCELSNFYHCRDAEGKSVEPKLSRHKHTRLHQLIKEVP